VSESVSKELV